MNSRSELFTVLPFLGFAVFAALIVGGVFYAAYLRRKALADLAASMGLLLNKDGPETSRLETTGLGLFNMGRSRKTLNCMEMRGSASSPDINFFDYHYVTGGGKNSHTHSLTVAFFDLKTPKVPVFELKPENLAYKIGELLGFKDIDLPSFPLFSDKYRLTGPSEAEVLAFFRPETAAYFEQHPGWHAQGAGRYLVVFNGERLVKPATYQNFMEDAKNLVASVVWG
jgi:hypothetical protein